MGSVCLHFLEVFGREHERVLFLRFRISRESIIGERGWLVIFCLLSPELPTRAPLLLEDD